MAQAKMMIELYKPLNNELNDSVEMSWNDLYLLNIELKQWLNNNKPTDKDDKHRTLATYLILDLPYEYEY